MPKISISVRPAVEKSIKVLAKKEGRSFSQMAAILIDDGIMKRVIPILDQITKSNKQSSKK